MRSVESTIVIHRKPALVLSAFTDPVHLKNWWGVERSLIELKKGGLYSLIWQVTNDGMGFVSTGIIAEYIPACQLKVENFQYISPSRPVLGPMELVILTTPENGSTTLTINQSGYQSGPDWDWYYEAVKSAWPDVIKKIKIYIEQLPN